MLRSARLSLDPFQQNVTLAVEKATLVWIWLSESIIVTSAST